jgi:hypothetical protein
LLDRIGRELEIFRRGNALRARTFKQERDARNAALDAA